MKKRMLFVLTLAFVLCGCGTAVETPTNSQSDTTEATTAAETTIAETTTAAETTEPTTEATAETTTEAPSEEVSEAVSETAARSLWFERGVYAVQADGAEELYYLFDDETSGRMTDPTDTLGFTCEQEEGQVIFHMGSADDNTIMAMSEGADGTLIGEIGGFSYIFAKLDGEDPDTFEINPASDGTSESEIAPGTSVATTPTGEINYSGHYSESISAKGSVSLTRNEDGSYRGIIRWAGAASEEGQWVFTGKFDSEGTLTYSDCVMDELSYEEDGSFTTVNIYTHGNGSITIVGDTLTWHDEQDKVAEFSKFIKR